MLKKKDWKCIKRLLKQNGFYYCNKEDSWIKLDVTLSKGFIERNYLQIKDALINSNGKFKKFKILLNKYMITHYKRASNIPKVQNKTIEIHTKSYEQSKKDWEKLRRRKTDIMDIRLPGSYGSGKKR